jgi:hypothetical protein
MDRDTAREKYERRSEETRTIQRIEGDGTVHTDLWSYGGTAARELIRADVRPGDRIVFETVLGSQVTGARREGWESWIWRRTTDELIEEHEAFVAKLRADEQAMLDEHRDDWTAREAALPEWLRERLAYFHAKGGRDFELGGWGYELTICEIAVILLAHDLDDDSPEVMAYARANGTSGNQHGMALALARAHLEDPAASMSGTVSALSPISGDPDYSGKAGQ